MSEFDTLLALTVPSSNPRAAEDEFQKFADTVEKLREAAAKTDTAPTEAQRESGNYKKGRLAWKGLTLVIETPAGEKRRPEWPALKDHYGYVAGTQSGADDDPIDVFISEAHPGSELVFIVNQRNKAGGFDEHKCVLGCISVDEAKATYLRNYSKGWTGMGEVTPITLDHFKWWLEHADTSKEVKNGFFAAKENLKPTKTASDLTDPATGHTYSDADEKETFDRADSEAKFWEENEAAKEKAKSSMMGHIRDGYILCDGCQFRYHAMPPDDICPKCGHHIHTRLRSFKFNRPVSKSAFDNYEPQLLLVKRAADEPDHPFTICVDLDGTLAEQEKPFNKKTIGPARDRAVHWVRLFHEKGARIIIFTVRGDTELVKGWLEENDVPFDYINENPDQPPDSSGKVYADVYWDDRAFNAEEPDEHGPAILRRVVAHHGGEEDTDDSPVITISRQTVITISGPSLLEFMEDDHGEEGE